MPKFRCLLLVLALIALVAAPGAQVGAQDNSTTPRKPLPYIVPEDTLLFVTVPDVPGLPERLSDWELARLLEIEEMQAFIAPLHEQITAGIESANAQLEETTGLTLEQVFSLFAGQISFAVISADLPAIQAATRNGQAPPIDAVPMLLVIDVDRSTEAFARSLTWLQQEMAGNEGIEMQTSNHEGTDISSVVAGGQAMVHWAVFNQSLLVSNTRDTLVDSLDRYRSPLPDGSLGRSPKYRHVRAGLPARGEIKFAYADVKALFAMVRTQVPPPNREQYDRVMELTGLSGIKAVGANAQADDGTLLDNVFIHVPGTRRGLVSVMSLPETPFDTLRHVRPDVTTYASMNFDLELLWIEILEAVRVTVPEAYMELQDALESQAAAGFDISGGLFGAVGGEMAAWNWLEDGLTHQTSWVTLKDAEAFSGFMEKMVDLMAGEAQLPIETVEVDGHEGWRLDNSAMQERGGLDQLPRELLRQIPPFVFELLESVNAMQPPHAYIMIVHGALVMTTSLEELQFIIANPEGREQSLATNPSFRQAREQGFARPSVYEWANIPEAVAPLYELVRGVIDSLAAERRATGQPSVQLLPFDFEHFPSLEAVQGVLRAGTVVEMRNTSQGIALRTRGGLMTLAGIGALAGVGSYVLLKEVHHAVPVPPVPRDPIGPDDDDRDGDRVVPRGPDDAPREGEGR